MPVNIPENLPAVSFLRNENISVITHSRLKNKNIASIKVLILNLMPKKIETENQFLRLLSYSHLQIDIYLLRVDQRISKNTSKEHVNNFYHHFEDIYKDTFDALIVTGAPLGLIDFKDVIYWSKITYILQWAKEHLISILFVCWSAQAALKIFYNIPKYTRKVKISGIYKHKILNQYSLLTRGFDDVFFVPHSRYADFSTKILRDYTDLEIFADSDEIGAYLFANQDKSLVFVTGHPEYDACTIGNEYQRDIKSGLQPLVPINYFQNNSKIYPDVTWRSHGNLLFSNWLYYYVYQKK